MTPWVVLVAACLVASCSRGLPHPTKGFCDQVRVAPMSSEYRPAFNLARLKGWRPVDAARFRQFGRPPDVSFAAAKTGVAAAAWMVGVPKAFAALAAECFQLQILGMGGNVKDTAFDPYFGTAPKYVVSFLVEPAGGGPDPRGAMAAFIRFSGIRGTLMFVYCEWSAVDDPLRKIIACNRIIHAAEIRQRQDE